VDATGPPPRRAPSCVAPPVWPEFGAGFAPHQLRHAHAVEMAREGVPLIVIQRQLGHSNLGITSVYLQGIDSGEIIETVHARRAPMIPMSVSLRL
jgi:integrase